MWHREYIDYVRKGELSVYVYFYDTDVGRIGIAERDGFIANVYFELDSLPEGLEERETVLIQKASQQLAEYLAGQRTSFDLPLAPEGTEFMQKVWSCLCEIPVGTTASYGEIAERMGHEKAYRAVGLANNRNPIPIFIPCHRVIGANGKLTGYRGGLPMKEQLLQLEQGMVK